MPRNREHEDKHRYYIKNALRIKALRKKAYWADPDKAREEGRRKYAENSKHIKKRIRNANYRRLGLDVTVDQLEKQCELCGSKKRLCADHNHKTKKYRGTLCSSCNLFLGYLELLSTAVRRKLNRYLRRR